LTLVALVGSIAATVTAVASATLAVIVAMIMIMFLTLAAIAMGMRQSRGVVGVEHLWGRRERVRAEREFLLDQAVSDHVEGSP
jgi:hypothetical protein